ncbi:MAG TPA: radical SAM family heme chaperone HemW [Phycisphaerae bacterium]|nr:radical SAM family heme chaperone HemW [Phycisphaerae bacterium]
MSRCKRKPSELSDRPGALYVHVPVCLSKCRYCDFYSRVVSADGARRFVQAVRIELDTCNSLLAKPLATIYVGGGTPTALDGPLLAELLGALKPLAGGQTEFTVEANPGTLDDRKADVLAGAGVNRASLGVQSFHPDELRRLGRIHTPDQARQAVAALRRAGVGNLSLDLMYALPGQTLETWTDSLRQALDLQPQHLSCYALSFEPGTPLHEDLAAGKVREMDEDLQRDCYDAARHLTAEAGLAQYEISNFARAGLECRHNLTYWRNEPYLGVGPAAASYLDGSRRTHAADLSAYVEAILAGRECPGESERLVGRAEMAETLMLGLRLTAGIDRAAFAARFGSDPAEAFPRSFARYRSLGAVQITPGRIAIAPDFLFVANEVLADLLAEA